MSQKVAYVTGGMGGIGTAICQRLHKEGFKVIAGCGPTRDHAKWLAEQKALGFTFYASVGNVGNWDSTVEAFTKAKAEHGSIDVLVNNAGITGSAQATVCHETPIDEWDRVLAVNVRGPFLCSRAALPTMLRQRAGHVITVASVAGLVAFPGRCAYTTSKGAAVQFTKSLAVDYAGAGIRANAVCPGMVETPMTQWRLDVPELRAQVESKIPLGRVAKPDEIADAIALLASDRLVYLTGHALVLDGGWTAL